MKTAYITINEIQNEYLPLGKKKLRKFITSHFSVKRNGNRILVNRQQLEEYLSNPDNVELM